MIEYNHFKKNNWMGESSSDRGVSRAIWENCPWMRLQNNPMQGFFYMTDFTTGGIVCAANKNAAAAVALGTTGDFCAATGANSGAISTLATDPYGVVTLTNGTTANEDAIIAFPKTAATAGQFIFSSGKELWMEARVKVSSITDAKINTFLGFAEENLAVTNSLIVNTGAMADKDYVGFVQLEGDGDNILTKHNTAGGGGATTIKSGAVVPVADTWMKLGMYFNGGTVYFYKDGVLLADSVAISATNFPDGEEMCFYAAIMGVDTTACLLSIDWIALAQAN